jgi:hypothetical protein
MMTSALKPSRGGESTPQRRPPAHRPDAHAEDISGVEQPTSPFRTLDDLVLSLKGLVVVRDLRMRAGASEEERQMFAQEMTKARNALAEYARHGSLATEPRVNSPRRLPTGDVALSA